MALSDPTTFYVTLAEYKTLTSQVGVSAMTDEAIKALILDVMGDIDASIEVCGVRFDGAQEFIFPRKDDEEDGVITIPRSLRDATVLIADAKMQRRTKSFLPHELKSWSGNGHSYERFSSGTDSRFGYFPPEAVSKLDRFISKGGSFAVV